MRKYTVISLLIGSLVFITSFSAGLASAQSSDPIMCGLWAGANLDVKSGLNCGSTPSKPSTSSPTTPDTKGAYVALGDSVAAGLGLPYASNTTTRDKVCGRSSQAYPSLVAKNLGIRLVNASCSGATVGDLMTAQHVNGPNIPPQLNTAFAGGKPKLISITAGANDIYWRQFLQTCYVTNCTNKGYDSTISALIIVMKGKYAAALTDIYLRSNGLPPRVLITGYYNPFSSDCVKSSSPITSSELSLINSKRTELNQALQAIANSYSFTEYVPISFAGHDMCSAQPWVQNETDKAPIHPNAKGQQAIATAVVNAYKN